MLFRLVRKNERTLLALLPAVVVDELVPGDPVDPGDGHIDLLLTPELPNAREESLLCQVLGERGRAAAAVEEVAVHAGQGLLIKGAEALRVEAEAGRSLRLREGHEGDRKHFF